MITISQFKKMFPNAKDAGSLIDAMVDIFPKYDITTSKRVAGFVAQTGHESGGFRALSENLNYSAKSLDAVFGKYFKRAGVDSNAYARQPEKIANRVYASRMDNGDEASGDGFMFRGGGILQLTGRTNYTKFGASVGITAEQAVDYVRTSKGAIESACWYWKTNNLNKYCDEGDIKMLTKRINGGYIGLEDRIHHWEMLLEALGEIGSHGGSSLTDADHDDVDVSDLGVLRRGSKGDGVKMMQEALGIGSDGDFGPGTERKLKEWQAANGLTADGIAGPVTLGQLLG
jgi:putative chitinase